jgi:hypothetical protein
MLPFLRILVTMYSSEICFLVSRSMYDVYHVSLIEHIILLNKLAAIKALYCHGLALLQSSDVYV